MNCNKTPSIVLKFLHVWRNFQFPHNFHTWKAEICPHDNFFSTNNIGDISDKYQVCIYISTYLSYVPCKYMFQFLAESMWWCWMVACPAMAGGDWTNPSTVFPKTCQTSSQNIRIYVALNIFSKHQNILSANVLLKHQSISSNKHVLKCKM